MSGPIRPPLRVRDTDSSPNVIPVNTIVVSDGDLVDDGGATVTIDTSGSGGVPATPVDSIQFNSDPAGTFTADSNFKMQVIGGDGTTSVKVGNVVVGGNGMKSVALNESIHLTAEGTGQVFLYGSGDAGGTFSDTIVNVMCWENADDAVLRLKNQNGVGKEANLIFDGSSDLILTNTVAAKDIDLKVLTTGQVEVANQTTDTDTVLSIMGNGTGAPRLDLQNASKRVWVECQANKKLTVQGGAAGNTFVFDVSSASGGITFPDSTVQTTAASGGGGGDGMLFCAAPPSSGYDYNLTGQSQGSQGNSPTLGKVEMYLVPFTVPVAVEADNISFGLVYSTGAWTGDFYVGIYESDANNLPLTLLDSATGTPTTAGTKTFTFGSTVSLSADTLYYASLSWTGTAGNVGYNGGYFEYGRSGFPIDNTSVMGSNAVGVLKYAGDDPPATLTTALITGAVIAAPKLRLGV